MANRVNVLEERLQRVEDQTQRVIEAATIHVAPPEPQGWSLVRRWCSEMHPAGRVIELFLWFFELFRRYCAGTFIFHKNKWFYR